MLCIQFQRYRTYRIHIDTFSWINVCHRLHTNVRILQNSAVLLLPGFFFFGLAGERLDSIKIDAPYYLNQVHALCNGKLKYSRVSVCVWCLINMPFTSITHSLDGWLLCSCALCFYAIQLLCRIRVCGIDVIQYFAAKITWRYRARCHYILPISDK